MELSLKTVAVMIITFLVVVALIIGVAPIKKLADAVLGFDNDKTKNKNIGEFSKEGISKNIISEIKDCLNNGDKICYCSMSNTFIPGNGVVEFKNIAEKLYIDFYSDAEVSSCGIDINSVYYDEIIFDYSSFFFENSYGLPDVISLSRIDIRHIDQNDYVMGNRAYWYGSKICSNSDVSGFDSIDFSNGILYKINENHILLTRKQEGLRACNVNSAS